MTTREHLLIDSLARPVASLPASVERCSALWLELASGRLEIVQASAEPGRSILILRARAAPVRPLGARAREFLERTLLAERRKVIASDMSVSVSMLALTLKASLVSMGLDCKPSQVSASLVMLIHGARGAAAPCGTFIGDCDHEDERFTIVTHVFDDSILRGLSPSQRAVMIMVANGRSCAHIAARRSRSGRTVINQIVAASRRLGASGRFELLRCFATGRLPRRTGRELLSTATPRLSSISPKGVGEVPSSMCG
jgi:DNA-binding NarL/FixJ family response regulator